MNKTHLHVHVTLDNILHIPKGWKNTNIILTKDNKSQVDKMLTKHYLLEDNFIKHILKDVCAVIDHAEVKRIKIEQETNFPDIIGDNQYLEIHAMSLCDTLYDGWVRSHNEQITKHNFVNARFYSGNIKNIIQNVRNIERIYDIRPELIILDTNHELDSWWA